MFWGGIAVDARAAGQKSDILCSNIFWIPFENASIKSKLLDCPGGVAVLEAAGFCEAAEAFVLGADSSMDIVEAVLQAYFTSLS